MTSLACGGVLLVLSQVQVCPPPPFLPKFFRGLVFLVVAVFYLSATAVGDPEIVNIFSCRVAAFLSLAFEKWLNAIFGEVTAENECLLYDPWTCTAPCLEEPILG